MAPALYDDLVAYLHERFSEDLRWVASFDSERYNYRVRYIRPDLTTELTNHELDIIIHRSIALFQKPHVEEVYSHLGPARCLVLEHERATAVHLYLGETDGLVIKIRAGNTVAVPAFAEECLAVLYPEGPPEQLVASGD